MNKFCIFGNYVVGVVGFSLVWVNYNNLGQNHPLTPLFLTRLILTSLQPLNLWKGGSIIYNKKFFHYVVVQVVWEGTQLLHLLWFAGFGKSCLYSNRGLWPTVGLLGPVNSVTMEKDTEKYMAAWWIKKRIFTGESRFWGLELSTDLLIEYVFVCRVALGTKQGSCRRRAVRFPSLYFCLLQHLMSQ